MVDIELSDLIDGPELDNCKIHLASWNGRNHPLDVFVSDRERWKGWNEYRGHRDDFNKKFIFSLIQFYPEADTWLFGGLFRVVARYADRYEVVLDRKYDNFVGRLKIRFKRSGRAKAVTPNRYFQEMTVSELLKEPYAGEEFPGYEDICLSFEKLETVVTQDRKDWRSALSSVKGVYLIADKSNGKKYVGSAYGITGIWSRWSCYIGNGHGHNDELTAIIKKHGKAYARKNFVFTLLEFRPMKADDQSVIDRECFWKKALLTRSDHGYNKN
ncbi:GIY-YIG nuclease family protein [Modicisalibacter coralii]|uniref:GIY-YIG nuclease family protein n=1 Tax=Modicisalibacter coralii TaxID=2304602 RepID=UPI00100B29B7|nr:GIY-YIG nuclease family protein [Halomonas coralii]